MFSWAEDFGLIEGNPTSVSRYAHLTPEHLKDAIRTLDSFAECHKPATSSGNSHVKNAVSH